VILPARPAVGFAGLGFGLFLVQPNLSYRNRRLCAGGENKANRCDSVDMYSPLGQHLIPKTESQDFSDPSPLVCVSVSGRLSLVTFFGLKESNITRPFALQRNIPYFTSVPAEVFFRGE
jgi:hypothetical protein